LLTDKTLGDQVHVLTGWKSVRTFKALWECIDAGKYKVTSHCNHFREDFEQCGERNVRPRGRVLTTAEAFFMHQFIMKQDVDFACAAYLFDISAASATRYMITMGAILDEYLTRTFLRMTAAQIYATEEPTMRG